MTAVLDASAVLALLNREPGHEQVSELLANSVMSAVNVAEVVQKLAQRSHQAPVAVAEGVRALGVRFEPFSAVDAMQAGLLWARTAEAGLSLGDRACLAVTGRIQGGIAITADRAWEKLDLGIPIRTIR